MKLTTKYSILNASLLLLALVSLGTSCQQESKGFDLHPRDKARGEPPF